MEKRFRKSALKWAYSFLKDWQLAEDVVQEAFLTAYKNIHQLQKPAAFPGWFKSIVHSHCHRVTRQYYRKVEVLEPEPGMYDPAPDDKDLVQNRWIANCYRIHEKTHSSIVYEWVFFVKITLQTTLSQTTVRVYIGTILNRVTLTAKENNTMIKKIIEVTTFDGTMPVHVFQPQTEGPHSVVIFYFDVFGIRNELKDMCRRLCNKGYKCVSKRGKPKRL